jgi:hypothetical protein
MDMDTAHGHTYSREGNIGAAVEDIELLEKTDYLPSRWYSFSKKQHGCF